MDKQDFTDTLKHGKCRGTCGNSARELHKCPNGNVRGNYAHDTGDGWCNCCALCEDACNNIHVQLEEIFGNVGDAVSGEIKHKAYRVLCRDE